MKKNIRVAGFFFIVCFLPFLRSCGDISVGFPAVAFSGKCIFTLASINAQGLFINMSVMVIMCAAAIYISRRRSPGPVVLAGLRAVIIYHIVILAGYLVSHPLYVCFTNSLTEYIAGIHLYAIYPLHEVFDLQSLERLSSGMKIYGDIFDMRFRIHYLVMVLFWFGAGCLIARIRLRRR